MHLGTIYVDLKLPQKAMPYLDEGFRCLCNRQYSKEDNFIYILLYYYANIGCKNKARNCWQLIKYRKLKRMDSFVHNVYGNYYELIGQRDSAIANYKQIMYKQSDEYAMYDASKALFKLYSKRGDVIDANRYGMEFVKLTEKLDFSKNQELAANVNNRFQYHLDKNHVKKTEYERNLFMRISISAIVFIILLILVFVIIYMKKKNASLNKQLILTNMLNEQNLRLRATENSILQKEQLLNEAHQSIAEKEKELKNINNELCLNEKLLKDAKNRIEEKMHQNLSLMHMLHQTKLEENASDVIMSIRKTSEGKKKFSKNEWQKLFTAVNNLYPDFKASLLHKAGKISEEQIKVFYLMRIGLTNPQIKNVMDLPRTTIWRWTNSQKWIFNDME